MLAFSNDYYGFIFRATQSVELFCAYGTSDHVGIVEKCEGGRVYTIEGNSSDQVRQRNYTVDYGAIMGYGRSW